MIGKKNLKTKMRTILLISMMLFISNTVILSSLFLNLSPTTDIIKETDDPSNDLNEFDSIKGLKGSAFGNAPWWNSNYEYRMLINITNSNLFEIKNFATNITFYYTDLVSAGKLQSNLNDIRIVDKNGIESSYYVVKDYPNSGYATVYFDTNISASSIETDTYLYFGNPSASNAESILPSESFGWIKNGDFELDIDISDKFEPYGWYFSHNPVEEIKGVGNPSPTEYNSSATSIQLFVNKLISKSAQAGGERVAQGNYSYKWGTPDTTLAGGNINDYAGTFFTYPFIVPTVTGAGISLQFFRNIRTFRFEEPKNPDGIDKDGYFIRILNGSNTVYSTDPDLHDDDDISHILFSNYAEAYDGHAYYNPSSKKWTDDTMLKDFPAHTLINDTKSDTSADGDLTGYTEIDLTPYMGKAIFFEIGVWGDESNALRKKKDAFFQVDNLAFNYTLTTVINDIQARKSDVTVIARDIDGRLVPNAEIIIINETSDTIVVSGLTSGLNGSVSFLQLLNGEYNVTANYTVGSKEIVVAGSMEQFNGTAYTVILTLDLWTIDFEIVDWDGIPMNLGTIEIYEDDSEKVSVMNLTLDNDGMGTFRWWNTADYYIKIHYDNSDYVGSPILLNTSYIYRNKYSKSGNKFQEQTLLVNNTNLVPKGESIFSVSERVYTNGSLSEFGNKRIIKFNVTLAEMIDQLSNISIYYIDRDNSTGNGNENLLYFKEYSPGTTSDLIGLDIPLIENAKLESESFDVYGLLIEVNGLNFSSQCNGTITVRTTETCNVFNRTHLARLDMRVIRDESGVEVPYPALIKITDNFTGSPIVNLTTNLGRDGYAYGAINDIPFWFLKDRTYNISINSLNETNVKFNVTYLSPPNQWKLTETHWYNYTLYGNASITFSLIFTEEVNLTSFYTAFFNASSITEVLWSNNMSFSVNFLITDDEGATWDDITDPSASCTIYIREAGESTILLSEPMVRGVGSANFTVTLNSSQLSAGNDAKYYTVTIEGIYPGYPDPSDQNFLVKVKAIPTTIKSYEYSPFIEMQTFEADFNELINISVKYSIDDVSEKFIKNANLAYEWLGLESVEILLDPIYDGYFTFTINSSDAITIGLKTITISAILENYTSQSLLISLIIYERTTTLNGVTALVYINSKVWVEDPNPFVFIYKDTITGDKIGNLTTATYTWEELYPNGSRIPGASGTDILVHNSDTTYTLDFRTEIKSIGFYYLYVTLHKQNYKAKSALINLEIKSREFNYTIPAEIIIDSLLTLRSGDPLDLDMTLHDMTRDIPLQNATISVDFQNKNYSFSEGVNGSYSLEITDYTRLTEDETSTTSTTSIIISKANFTTQIIDITVLLNNRIFNLSISEPFRNNLIKIVSGDRLSFDIALNDSYDDSLITDGTVTIFIGGVVYEDLSIMNNGDGTYTITFLSYPEAFTSSKTLSGEIIIQKTNFKTERIPITIEIKMTEILPGMPTFYFILITLSIIGILGSAVGYRVIQQARIPKHVKKIRKIKGIIKSKKTIEELISVPSKEQMIAKIFGNDWKEIGLSLDETLGIQDLKSKKLALKGKISKEGGVD
ncbi:MAG: DUF2341 domain-containing protein [Candidatus Lokiarchaeia archaeon]